MRLLLWVRIGAAACEAADENELLGRSDSAGRPLTRCRLPVAGGVGMKDAAAATVGFCSRLRGGGVGTKLCFFFFLLEFGFFSLSLFLLPRLRDFFTGAEGPLKADDEVEEEEVTEVVTSPAGWKLAKLGASPVFGA